MKKLLFVLLSLVFSMGAWALPANAQTCGTQVTVQSGDTLWDIARRCDTTVPAILEANFQIFDPSMLSVGQTITIPSAQDVRPPQVSVYPLGVSPGDTVQIIANGFPITTDVSVIMGQDQSEPSVNTVAETDEQGALSMSMTVPSTANLNGRWVVIVQTTEGQHYEARSFTIFINEQTTQPPVPAPDPTQPADNLFTETQIYLISAGTGGNVGCGDSVVPYTVSIQPTVAPLTAALNQLFALNTQAFGYYNALGSSNLSVAGIDIENGVATVELTGQLMLAGVCDNPRVEAQLRQTALQYHTIDDVNFFINGQPLESLLSGQG